MLWDSTAGLRRKLCLTRMPSQLRSAMSPLPYLRGRQELTRPLLLGLNAASLASLPWPCFLGEVASPTPFPFKHYSCLPWLIIPFLYFLCLPLLTPSLFISGFNDLLLCQQRDTYSDLVSWATEKSDTTVEKCVRVCVCVCVCVYEWMCVGV